MTETLLAWGVGPVACTRFCEQPALRHVGGTKDPDVAAIVELRPDLVVLDREENRLEDHDALVDAGLAVHATTVRSVADLDEQMPALADVVGATWTPLGARPATPTRARAWIPIWKRPWMALGEPTYGSSLLRQLGVGNVAASDGPYPELDPDAVRRREPDLVIAPSEPYPFAERHRAELKTVAPVCFVDGRDLLWWGARTAGAIERLAQVIESAV